MIVVRICGGLGNQMFQYALGRRLAIDRGVTLKLDISWFETETERMYELDVFQTEVAFADPDCVGRILNPPFYRYSNALLRRLNIGPLTPPCQIFEKQRFYDSDVLKIGRRAYLKGYWQSAKYFECIENVIRRDFTFRNQLEGKNLFLAERIISECSVNVHVRRGDYVSNPHTASVHGVCSIEYYRTALEILEKRSSESLSCYVFSDDIAWAQQNLSFLPNVTFVSHNGPNFAYEDMRLMSLCKYHIIANSSFSWWGAWLSSRLDKLVIAPRKWFVNNDISNDSLLLEGWIKI